MDINYQDNNLIVSYVQIFLSEYFSTYLRQVKKHGTLTGDYEIVSNREVRVTGYWDVTSYTSLALYMAYNYPKEGYPMRWYETSDGEIKSEDYVYEGNQEELIEVIKNNIEFLYKYRQSLVVPERVLSYIFNEVVTPLSSSNEILRVRKLFGESLNYNNALKYDDALTKAVEDLQSAFIEKYTANGQVQLPDQYKGFKVTGYVDPWTERIIRGL